MCPPPHPRQNRVKLTNKTKFRREIKLIREKKEKTEREKKKNLHLVSFLRGLGPSSQKVARKP